VLTLTCILIAIYFLECNNLVHRDISYANILIRGEGKDSAVKAAKRREIMHELDLSEIDSLRTSLGCREGLLIDFDYASLLLNRKTAQADASNVNRSPGENQCEGQSSLQSSSQGESEADFEVIDNEDDSNTQPFNNISGTRTVSYF
jgi:serine/threonine protein kinase